MSKKLAAVQTLTKAICDFRTNRFVFTGPTSMDQCSIPVGLSRVTCNGFIGIAFINPESKEIVSMFSLEPGKRHVVKCPDGVLVVVECAPDVQWYVEYSNRFNKSDPTRVETTLVRPRTQQEEMQDYLNEVAARAAGAEHARMLREGKAEFDMSNDDWSETHEDDQIAPLTVYQMEGILKILQEDIAAERQVQKDIEEEDPAIPLQNRSSSVDEPPATKVADSGEVKQK